MNGEKPGERPGVTIGEHWRARFGAKVRRVSLDPGFSCPNRDGTVGAGGCVYCDEASFSPSAGDPRPVGEQLRAAIYAHEQKKPGLLYAAYLQPRTNTHAPLAEIAKVLDEIAREPRAAVLCVGTRPDAVPDAVLALLASRLPRFGEIWLELGLQSSHDRTLRLLNRGHGSDAFADAAKRAAARGLKICAHIILGLPGETASMERETADFIASLPVEGVKLHQLSVIRGTVLEKMYREGFAPVLTEEEYASRAAAFIKRLPPGIILHRLVGDILGENLIAPRFDKGRVLRILEKELSPPLL